MATLLKVSSDVAALMKAILEMSEDVAKAATPLDMQGKLLRLHNSIQKNRGHIAKHVNDLCDMIDAQKATDKRVSRVEQSGAPSA
jgi:hypothetical protein